MEDSQTLDTAELTTAVQAALWVEEYLTRRVTQRQHTRVSRPGLLVSLRLLTTIARTTMTLTIPTKTGTPPTHTISKATGGGHRLSHPKTTHE